MAMLPSHKSKAAKKEWLHPPISAHSQASPPRQPSPQRKTRTTISLKINDHVSYTYITYVVIVIINIYFSYLFQFANIVSGLLLQNAWNPGCLANEALDWTCPIVFLLLYA